MRFAHNVADFRQEIFFLWWRERNGRIKSCQSDYRSVELIEGLLVNDGADLAGDSARFDVLMQQDDLVSAADCFRDGLFIDRRERSQIQNFDLDSIFREVLGSLECDVHHRCISNDAEVAAMASYP